MAGYLCYHVERNSGSTRSVQNALVQLRVYASKNGLPWLSAADAYNLKRTVAALEYADATPSRAKRPATLDVLGRVVAQLDLKVEWQLAFAASLLLGHNALLRAGELLSGLRVRDLRWDLEGEEVTLLLARSKTHRRGPAAEVAVRRYVGLNAYDLLRRLLRVSEIGGRADAYIFPHVGSAVAGNRVDYNRPMLRGWWVRTLRLFVSRAGLESNLYSGHSLRAGGATDLFTAGVSYPAIKKAGRWTSEAALRYFRQKDYVASEVARAFGRQARAMYRSTVVGAGDVARGTRVQRRLRPRVRGSPDRAPRRTRPGAG